MENNTSLNQAINKLIQSVDELKKFVKDELIYGIGILVEHEDGSFTRIDPNSEEGQKILKDKQNEG